MPHSAESVREALALVASGLTQAEVAAKLGVAPRTLSDWVRGSRRPALRGDVGGPPIPEIGKPPEGFAVYTNTAKYDEAGNLKAQWVGTKRDHGEVFEVRPDHFVNEESAYTDADGRVIGKWTKTKRAADKTDGLIEGLRAAFAEYEGKAPEIPVPSVSDGDLLTIYPLPDLHLGMMSWGKECGDDYDLKIATDLALSSVETLVAQSRPSRHAVLLGLGDYFHADDQKNATPGSGHQLDVDGRHAKVFSAGAKLATQMIDIIARKHEFVEIRFLSGNHDINSAMCLTVALSLFYSNNQRITVNTDPGIAWYRRFGACLLGATHGHTMKMEQMPMMMAADRAADWGASRHRNFFSGHVHHQAGKEIAGVLVESLQSPAARDAWNAASGYRSGRSLSAITFHSEEGETGRHRINLASARAKVAA